MNKRNFFNTSFFVSVGILFLIFSFSSCGFSFEDYFPASGESGEEIRSENQAGATEVERTKNQAPGAIEKTSEVEELGDEKEFQGTIDDIISLANEARKAAGVSPLRKNETLCRSALLKAEHMRDNHYFEHTSPDGIDYWFFIEKVDYNYKTSGENLAKGFFSAAEVHEGWMNSQGHRENILSPDFEEIGVANLEVEENGQKVYLTVQHFGTVIKPEDVKTVYVCKKEEKKNCEKLEDREEEVEDLVKEQKEIIEDARDQGFSKKDLRELYDNLDDLEEAEDELEEAVEKCEEFLKKCDRWE